MAQEPSAGPVVVADVRGPLDQLALDFLEDVVRNEDAQLVVLKIDNPGVASGDTGPLLAAMQTSETPVVVWIGPDGAVAYGEVLAIVDYAAMVGAAPGARIGFWDPSFEGHVDLPDLGSMPLGRQLINTQLEVSGEIPPTMPISVMKPTQ